MFDLDAFIANKDLILKDRDNRADVQKVLSVYAEKVDSTYTVKAKWSDIFVAMLQGMKVQAQVITLTEADEEEETDASAVVETYDLYDATVTADGFSVNGTDLSASSADAYPVGSLSRPSSGGGGGEGGVLVCHTGDNDALDHTWQEIHDAPCAVMCGGGENSTITSYLVMTDNSETPFVVQFMRADDSPQLYVDTLYADSADDYPEFRDFGGGDGGGGGGII